MSGRLKSIRALRWQAQRVCRAAPHSATSQSLDHERSCDRGRRHWRPGVRRSCGAHGPDPVCWSISALWPTALRVPAVTAAGMTIWSPSPAKAGAQSATFHPAIRLGETATPSYRPGEDRYHTALGYGKLVPEQKHVHEYKNYTSSRHNLNASFTAAQSLHQQSLWPI